jgi:hypothetical protein
MTVDKALNDKTRGSNTQNVFLDKFEICFLITNCAPLINAILPSQGKGDLSPQLGNVLPTPESSPPPNIIFYTLAAYMDSLPPSLLTHPQEEESPEYSSTMLPHANEQEDPPNEIRKVYPKSLHPEAFHSEMSFIIPVGS